MELIFLVSKFDFISFAFHDRNVSTFTEIGQVGIDVKPAGTFREQIVPVSFKLIGTATPFTSRIYTHFIFTNVREHDGNFCLELCQELSAKHIAIALVKLITRRIKNSTRIGRR
jgi:hypothetical protein